MKKNYLFLLFFLTCFTTCSKDKNKVVDQELAVYVDRFFAEAAARNVEISDNDLEVVFKDLSAEGVCGLGFFRYLGTDLRKVEINSDFFCWGFHDDLAKENLVFHELGHAILKRVHVNGSLPNGLPANMMCDGNTCNVFSYYDQYTKGKREFYVDKLFNPGTANPDWGKIKTKALTYFEEDAERTAVKGVFEISDPTTNNFEQTIIENPLTNSKSIRLVAKEQLSSNVTAHWAIRLKQPNIMEGVGLQLSAVISSNLLIGDGAAMTMRTYSGLGEDKKISAGVSNRPSSVIKGNISREIYTISIPYFPSDVEEIELLFQLLPNTSGTVYFDEINLSVMEL